MKKRILSLFLTVAMMLSVMAILPISVNAEEVATFDGETNLTIKNYADIAKFDEMVEGGEDFDGVTIILGNDITLDSDFAGIGANNGGWKRFAGTFDGQGYTITANGHNVGDDTGAFFVGIDGATIQNVTFAGRVNIISSYGAGVVCSAAGDNTIKNVRVSLYMQSTAQTLTYCSAFVATMATGTNSLIIDNCVFDGTMNFSAYAEDCGGFLAQTISSTSVTITNSVFAGKICFNDGNSKYNGGFIGYARVNSSVTVENCISIGEMTFANKTAIPNSLVVGERSGANDKTTTINNFYYVPFNATVVGGSVGSVGVFQGMTAEEAKGTGNIVTYSNVATKTLDELAALTSDTLGFSEDAAFSFAENTDLDTYYPCPTSMLVDNAEEGTVKLVKEGEWVDSLKVSVDAKVLGARIRITDAENDPYSGIRFEAKFRETENTTGVSSAEANFGIILISKATYEGLEETTYEAIAGAGVVVNAVKATTEDGVITVKATVYNIGVENYKNEIVAVCFVNGEIVGDEVVRSIYNVAQECVTQNNDTAKALAFAAKVIDDADNYNAEA